jgi:hypothetical protein
MNNTYKPVLDEPAVVNEVQIRIKIGGQVFYAPMVAKETRSKQVALFGMRLKEIGSLIMNQVRYGHIEDYLDANGNNIHSFSAEELDA